MLETKDLKLTPDQQLRLELVREFDDDAQSVYDFITAGRELAWPVKMDTTEVKNAVKQAVADFEANKSLEGVYIIYKDGHREKFNCENSKEDVKSIGVIFGFDRIAVALHDLGGDDKEYKFIKDSFDCPGQSEFYTRDKGINAFEDWDGAGNTEHIKADYKSGMPLQELGDGEYIPSLGEWGLLMRFASTVNEALEYVGGHPIKGWYWSSTESSQYHSWTVYFNDGNCSNYTKYSSVSVRAVAAF